MTDFNMDNIIDNVNPEKTFLEDVKESSGDDIENTIDGKINDYIDQLKKDNEIEKIEKAKKIQKLQNSLKHFKDYMSKKDINITYKESADLLNKLQEGGKIDPGTSGTLFESYKTNIETNFEGNKLSEAQKSAAKELNKQALKSLGFSEGEAAKLVDEHSSGNIKKTQADYDKVEDNANKLTEELQRKIKEFENSNFKDKTTFKDVVKVIGEIIKVLIPIFEIWFIYNLIRYAFSHCSWKAVNKNCRFNNSIKDSWQSLETTDKTLPGSAGAQPTFLELLTFQNNSKYSCACNDTPILNVAQDVIDDKPNKLSYGFISLGKADSTPGNKKCDNDNSIACQANTPVCLTPTTDKPTDMTAKSKCNGTYEYYDCDLGEMLNGFANLVKELVDLNPMTLIKWIIIGVVGIIVLYLLITIIMSIFKKDN